MRITDVKTVLLTGPSTNDPYLSVSRSRRSAAFIEIHTDGTHVGIGETYGGYFVPEVIPHIVDFYKPILLNAEMPDVHTVYQHMARCGVFWGRVGLGPVVLSGIEAALWDLKGKMLGLPVYELLGGRCHDRLLAYATGGPSLWPSERLLEKVDFYLNLGFRAFKIGTGYFDVEAGNSVRVPNRSASVDLEAEKARLLRQHVGPEISILMDGHMGFRTAEETWDVDTAIAVLRALESYDLFLFEEPLPYTDPWGYAELCRATNVPVAGGEQLTTLTEFCQFAERDAFDIAQPDAAFVGGMSEFARIGALFASRNRRVATHAWGAGGAVMQNLHAAFATPNTTIVELPPAAGALHTAVWREDFQFRDGYVLPPQLPGLGIQLTEDIKERFPFVPGSGEFVSVPGKILKD
jgi:L-alanine-DL-glutamate epimerase-like enolase superfamily enzyme